MPKSNTEKGGEVCEEQCFSSSLPVGKTGLGTWWHPTKHWKGAGGSGVGSGVHFLSFPRLSFNSTLPHCPQVHPFLEPGGACEVCVCVWKVLGGGFYWNRTEWNLSHCLSSCTPPPRCLTRCLPPSFSTDKECPECLASPAVSDN